MLLEIIGALALTGLVVYVTLAALAMQFFSDESYFFGIGDEPIAWIIWHVGSLALAAAAWWGWWVLVGSQISISIGVK